MKKIILLLLLFSLFSCTKKEYGTPAGIKTITAISSLKKNPENYINSMIKITGIVVDESEKGSWITLKSKNNSKVIYVNFDYKPEITIDNIIHKEVMAEGRFVKAKEGYFIRGNWCKVIN